MLNSQGPRYRFKLKGFEKKPQLRSDGTSPSSPPHFQPQFLDNKLEKSAKSMHKFGDLLESFTAMFEKVNQNMELMQTKLSAISRHSESFSTPFEQEKLYRNKSSITPTQNVKNEENKEMRNYSGKENFRMPFCETSGLEIQHSKKDLDIEERFKLIHVEIPALVNTQQDSEERDNEIYDWVSTTCKKIFSATFKQLLLGNLNNKAAKTYCSQNMLYRLIQFTQKNSLTAKEIKNINIFLKETLLPYFQLKYPQSESNQVNLRLSNKIQKIDNYNSNSNDLVYSTNTKFEYLEKGIYNESIMKVLNYIIDAADGATEHEKKNKELMEKERVLQELKKEEREKKGEVKNDENSKAEQKREENVDDETEETTFFTAFCNDMEDLFKKVQDEDEIIRMRKSLSPSEFVLKYKKLALAQKDPAKKQLYKEKVKAYTKFLIGRKVSESVTQYDPTEVKSGHLYIKNSQVLRILNKWCSHLREKFENTGFFIEERQEPFRMQDGSQGYLSKTHRLVLSKLMQKQEENIQAYMNEVLQNNYEFQESMAKKSLPKRFDWFSKEQSTVGLFTATLFQNNQNYIIGYLNKLIHSLLKVTTQFNDIINLERHRTPKKREKMARNMTRLCINKMKIEDFLSYIMENKSKKRNFNYQSVPQLVTFRIGDLMRCKCSSKETEISAIYKEIMRISHSNPGLWKVNRIKNRLAQGTRDVLINLVYRDKMIVQVQLQVDEAKSHFIMCSSSFKHYLYELGRAEFGPVSEMSSIWMNHDSRSEFYRKQLSKTNIRDQKAQKVHHCYDNLEKLEITEPINSIQTFPFECFLCKKLWTNSHFVQPHIHCNLCQKNICGYCQIEMDIKIVEPNFRAALNGILDEETEFKDENQKIPDFGACMNLYAKDTIIQQYRKVYYEYKAFLFEIAYNGAGQKTYNLLSEVTSQEQKKHFLETYYVISLQEEFYREYSGKMEEKKNKRDQENIIIAQHYFLPRQFQTIVTQKRSSILQEGKHISNQTFDLINICEDVTKINFSENKITAMGDLMGKFPKLEIAVLASNAFQELPNNIGSLSSSITYLDLNNNQISTLPNSFVQLTNLKYLNLSRNKLQDLPENFDHLEDLKDFIVGYNELSQLQPLPVYLKRLDLQHNRFSESISIKKLNNLVFLNLAFNFLKFIEGLSNTQTLKTLDLSNNSIVRHKFKNLYSLENLLLPFNSIEEIQISYEDPNQSNLRILNLNNNKIKQLSDDFFKNIKKVESLSLAQNKLQFISEAIFNLEHVEDLNLSAIRTVKFKRRKNKNKHPQMIKKSSQKSKQLSEFAKHTEQDKVEGDDLQVPYDILPPNSHLFLNHLVNLNLSNNKLPEIPETISKMVQLKELDLSSNRIRAIDLLITVDVLDLRTNKIAEFNQTTANYLNTLKTLYIKSNPCNKDSNPTLIKSIIKNLQVFDLGESTGSQSSMGSRNSNKNIPKSNKSLKSYKDSSSECSDQSIQDKLKEDFDHPKDDNASNMGQNDSYLGPRKLNHLAQRLPSGLGKRKKMSLITESIVEEADKQNVEYAED